jgi:hypothetical protein
MKGAESSFYAVKTYRERIDIVPPLLIVGTRWEWSALHPGRFTPWK